MSQKDIFLNSEADFWFKRNQNTLRARKQCPHLDKIIESLPKHNPLKILEIGSSDGTNLDYIKKNSINKDLTLFGVDPSKEAIDHGKEQFTDINLALGTSDDLSSFEGQVFDVIILGFCLYLVDRELLPKTVYEIDSKLKPGGQVIIFDFDSKYPSQNKYIHCEGINSFKMDYSQMFLGFPNYTLIDKISWSHQDFSFTPDKNERCSTWTLFKEL